MSDYKRIYPDIQIIVNFDNLQFVKNFYGSAFEKGLLKQPIEEVDPLLFNFAVNAFSLGVSTGLKLAEVEATLNFREGASSILLCNKDKE